MSRKYFMKYAVELVKEDDCKYEGKVSSSTDAYNKILEVFKLDKKAEEHFVMFCLNMRNEIIGAFLISKGGINYTHITKSDIIKRALLCNSNKIIIAHNHPSGNVEPSNHDINATKQIKEACEIMDIKLLDHLIIGENNYVSLYEKLF